MVRLANLSDAASFHRLAASVAYSNESADGTQGFLVTIRSIERFMGCIETSPCALVAEEDGGAVGMLWTIAMPEFQKGLWIEQIGVDPAFKGKGVAQAMLDEIRRRFQPDILVCEIYHKPILNERSRGFFTKNGFVLEKEASGSLPNSIVGQYCWRRIPK